MSLSISQTGIRNGEYIIGANSAKQCAGSILQIFGTYPPAREWVQQLTSLQIRDEFNNYKFFKGMSAEERSRYLHSQAIERDPYLEDVEGLMVRVIELKGKFMTEMLTTEQISSFIAGNPQHPEGLWPIRTLFNAFPKDPRSRSKKHTLVFRPNNWTLRYDEAQISTFNGIIIDADTGALSGGTYTRENGFLFVMQGGEKVKQYAPMMGVVSRSYSSVGLQFENLAKLNKKLNYEIMVQARALISWFPPSMHKSLIQKIIRTRCTHVEYGGVEYPAEEVLITSFIMLLLHPGSFVHNIQRFVSGMESALKRLAVSILEDSYIADPIYITTLLAGAWIAQNEKDSGWNPSESMVAIWIEVALLSLRENRMYDYDWHSTAEAIREWNSLYINYYLLCTLRSFVSDERMLCSIAERGGRPRTVIEPEEREKRVMPLIHCVDHHSFTHIVHYFPTSFVTAYTGFRDIFIEIWNGVVGYNPRKGGTDIFKTQPTEFQRDVRVAQTNVWISQMYTPKSQEKVEKMETFKFKYNLKAAWLSAMLGPIELRMGGNIIITVINPDNLQEFTSVRRPPRGAEKADPLTEEEKVQARAEVVALLGKGMMLKNVPSMLPMFAGSAIYYIGGVYYIARPGKATIEKWDDVIQMEMDLPIYTATEKDVSMRALTHTNDGITSDVGEFGKFLQSMPLNALKRSLLYLSSYNETVELYHISREDGHGTEYSVAMEDIWVHHLLLNICAYYPGALQLEKQRFRVKNGPLMWSICDVIKQMANVTPIDSQKYWNALSLIPEKRRLWEHQTEAVERLGTSIAQGHKTRIIWITPGLGKTAIVTNYIAGMIINGTMPNYCIYTCPPEAAPAILEEFRLLGIPIEHVDMRASAGGSRGIRPGVVSLIYHDHIRMADLDAIRLVTPHTMLINDEFHKTVERGTIRTSLALELARLCNNVIAMTGTLIKDTNVADLNMWLEQSVDFHVTEQNYWVAISTLISRKIETRVSVERSVLESPFTKEEQDEYNRHVTAKFGGTAQRFDFRPALETSYLAVTRGIIEQVIFYHSYGVKCFVVARNSEHQLAIERELRARGIASIDRIYKDHALNFTSKSAPGPDVVITTTHYSTGYNMSQYRVMITGVYLTGEDTREQLEHRINRIDQTADSIRIVILHSGVLSYIHNTYEKVRSMSMAAKEFAKTVDVQIDFE